MCYALCAMRDASICTILKGRYMVDTIGIIFISLGLAFDFLGCLGLVRFPDVYNRLQAATKCITFGTLSILFGSFLILGWGPSGTKCLLAMGFVLLTSPTSSHALARAARKANIKMWNQSVCDEYEEKGERIKVKG